KRLCTLLDASGKLQVGALEDAAEIGSPGGKRLGRLADALAEGLVCALEVAQDVAGTLCQRLRRFHRTRDQPLIGRVECRGNGFGPFAHAGDGVLAMRQQSLRCFLSPRSEEHTSELQS